MEKQISDSLDNKSGIFITAFGVLFTIWMQVLPMVEAKEMIADTKEFIIQISLISAMLFPVLIGILTCIFFIISRQTRDFLSVITVGDEAESTESFLCELIGHLQVIIIMV